MIFIATGSQKFQFNRLLEAVDLLVQEGKINEKVVAQTGSSTYRPHNFEWIDFMSSDLFNKYIDECDIVITHGGTGVIVNAIKKGKKVIGVPRLKKYKEHIDDHQIQILDQFKQNDLIESCLNLEELPDILEGIKKKKFSIYKSNKEDILKSIKDFITEGDKR